MDKKELKRRAVLCICCVLMVFLNVALYIIGIKYGIDNFDKIVERYVYATETNEPKQEQPVIEEIQQEPEPVYIYVPREEQYYIDLELLAHLIYAEVGQDGEEAMYYAGSVVLNRIKNHEYPDDLYSVIYQKGQYEVTWNGGLYKETPSDIAYEVAADLLEEGSIIPEGVVYQAEFKQGSGTFKMVGDTYFCYQ